ncbi:MAG: hypothetical protein ACR2KS_05455 [Candidatus Eremiobacter antarcticus]|nr:hypothetical protein [Candidatus Eremiobacteraeota bacterium]MBC5808713.1 hypothetical protein [Candidatus Eremiobacteraeota bacterium]
MNFVANGRGPAATLAVLCLLTAFGTAAEAGKPHVAAAMTHASSASKHHQDPQDSPQTADDAHRFSISGIVVAVHYDANSVTISSGDKRSDIVITPTTVIEYRHEVGSIADIHKGRKIAASGVVRDGAMIALTIVLK